MIEKILTVVVPTYNVEKYIRQNLESMEIPEIMDDLEVLVVSDGSKDSSADIAKEFETKYPGTYRVIEKENGGGVAARANGTVWASSAGIIKDFTSSPN